MHPAPPGIEGYLRSKDRPAGISNAKMAMVNVKTIPILFEEVSNPGSDQNPDSRWKRIGTEYIQDEENPKHHTTGQNQRQKENKKQEAKTDSTLNTLRSHNTMTKASLLGQLATLNTFSTYYSARNNYEGRS